jgi:mono/diheme cytochrome c family protein
MTAGRSIILAAIVGAGSLTAAHAAGQTRESLPAQAPPHAAASPTVVPSDALGRGQALFALRCQACHDPAVEDAPAKADMAGFAPGFIADTLKNGDMRPRAQGLSDDDIAAIAAYLTAR